MTLLSLFQFVTGGVGVEVGVAVGSGVGVGVDVGSGVGVGAAVVVVSSVDGTGSPEAQPITIEANMQTDKVIAKSFANLTVTISFHLRKEVI